MSFPTRKAALGLIARRPTYGYAVLQQLRGWALEPETVRTSSVYTALSRLEADQLIESRQAGTSPTSSRPSPIVYRVTDAGRLELDAWLASTPLSYDELRLRIALARPQDLPLLIRFVSTAERSCVARLRDRQVPSSGAVVPQSPSLEALCGALLGTLDVGELSGRAKWLQEARVVLESMHSRPDRLSVQRILDF